MNNESSAFGADPEQIDKLLAWPLDEDMEETPAASLDRFAEGSGSRIGYYKLLRILGEGGMGIVYLAQQEEPVKREVALKVIKPGMDSKRVIARFEAERQTLALLDHPNIAHVHDAGTTEAGRPYFVMEYVKGLPITEHCDRYKLTIEDRLNLFSQVCRAVQHAHQKGIIHRDIKPSNILVSAENDQVIPKIIDFGVAKATAQPLTERTLQTEESQLLGTPEYMSPEQADMANEDIDTRSDVYSLGVLLYELLTGVLPFESETLREGGIDNIRKVIRQTDPKTPSTRLMKLGQEAGKIAENRRTEIHTLARHLKKELEWIPLKAMRKERAERYRSTSELADDVENYLKRAPLIAGPPGTVYQLKKFVRRNRVAVVAIAAVLTALSAGIVTSTLFATRARRANAESVAILDFLRNDLLAAVDPHQAQGDQITVRYLLDAASASLEGEFDDRPLVEASIRLTLGDTYLGLGLFDEAVRHLRQTCRLRTERLGEEHPETIYATFRLCGILWNAGRAAEAQPLCLKTVERSKRILGKGHRTTLLSMNILALVCETLTDYGGAEQLFREILETSRNAFVQPDVITPLAVGNLANLLRRTGRYEEAEPLCLEALELRRQVFGEDHPYTIDSLRGLGLLRAEQERYEEAEELLTESLEKRRRVQGREHERTIRNIVHLGRVHTEQQHYGEAEALLLEAYELSHRVIGPHDQNTIESIRKIVELYEAWNKPEKAKEWRAKLEQIEDFEK